LSVSGATGEKQEESGANERSAEDGMHQSSRLPYEERCYLSLLWRGM